MLRTNMDTIITAEPIPSLTSVQFINYGKNLEQHTLKEILNINTVWYTKAMHHHMLPSAHFVANPKIQKI